MIRLVRAELLKLRRRWASYIVLALLVGLMTLLYLLVALVSNGRSNAGTRLVTHFPGAYGLINQFVFGLGSLLAVAYAAAIAGSDWTWGVLRVIVARGESRGGYILAKAIGLGIVLCIGAVIAYLAGIALTLLSGALTGASTGDPLRGDGLAQLARSIAYGSLVLLERCAIGFAVAVLLRSQLAGVVVGIVLYIGESIVTSILLAISIGSRFGGSLSGTGTLETQWFQYLPFTIGNSVLSGAPGSTGDLGSVLLTPVPLATALAVTAAYLVVAVGVTMLVTERAEISS